MMRNHRRATSQPRGACARIARLAITLGCLAAGGAAAGPAAAAARPRIDVIPRPAQVRLGHGSFHLTGATRIVVARHSAAARSVAADLAGDLRPATGFALPVVSGPARPGDITLTLAGAAPAGSTASEAYTLRVTPTRVALRAATPHGLFDAVQTARQLLPAAIAASHPEGGPWTMPAVRIADHPRYAYRGFMLDLARHYHSPADVERLIAEISADKIDVLHLHLGDDQGFRIVINGFPRLTRIGARGSVGTHGRKMDPGGFWTQAQYRAVVADATAHFITVVPEVDSPGHSNAIVMSEYGDTANPLLDGAPQSIDCTTKRPPQWNYTEDVGYSALCPESSDTWTILSAIIDQLTALSPGPYYDLGGDEVPTTVLSHSRYAAFINRESGLVAATGKTAMGWADFAGPGATPPAGSIAEYWDTGSGSDAATITAREAVAKHLKVVMAPANRTYLDQKYVDAHHRDIPRDLGQNWACPTGCDVTAFYDWDPAHLVTGVTGHSVIGVEAPIFGETTPTLADVQYLAFPRLLATAELGWSPAARRAPGSPAESNFLARLGTQGARLMYAGVNFYPSAQVRWALTVTPAAHPRVHGRTVSGPLASVAAPGLSARSIRGTISWGDGTRSLVAAHGRGRGHDHVNAIATLTARHTYRTRGRHTVTVTVSAPHRPAASVVLHVAG